ncbi:MAG: GyrI-like domain-containing protein [Anaerolineales bacterium]
MSKVDFKKEYKVLFSPPREFVLLEVPEMQFLMVDGHGDPNVAQEYQEAVEALYAVAYKIKFASKKQLGRDYVVPPLEGLWWAEDMGAFTTARDKSKWDWTMMIMTPEWISQEMYADAVEQVRQGKHPAALEKVRLERYNEGLSVQIMHIGSYDDEGPTLMKMHNEFLPENGYVENGKHHEIYLGDPRKLAPEKLKTVLRQPVRKL